MSFHLLNFFLRSLNRLRKRVSTPTAPFNTSKQSQNDAVLPLDVWRDVQNLVDLPESFGSLLRGGGEEHRAKLEYLVERLAGLSGQELVDLDIEARRWQHSEYGQTAWARLRPENISRIEQISPFGSPHLLGLASFHPNGYTREAALRALGRQASPDALPYLLLRLNDWAEPIRNVVLEFLPAFVALQSGESILHHLDLVLRLKLGTRGDHSHWVSQLLGVLAQPVHRGTLIQGLRSPSLLTRRVCFDLALTSGILSEEELLTQSRKEADPLIRLNIQRSLLSKAIEPTRTALLTIVLNDPIPFCRRAALAWLMETQAPDRESWSLGALLDGNRSVRDTARWILREVGYPDVREVYLAGLRAAVRAIRIAAVHGLGEVGGKKDAPLLTPFLDSQCPREHQAALAAIGRLDASNYRDEFLEALASDNPRTSRMAREILLKGSEGVSLPCLLDLYRTTPYPHVCRQVLHLTTKLPKWQAMTFFLDVLPRQQAAIDPDLEDQIMRWLRSLLRVPPPQGSELLKARSALESARERLGWYVFPELDATLSIPSKTPWH